MTEGTSQGLFIVVAIVIFGIFVSLSYTLFGKTLQPQVVSLFEQGTEKVQNDLTSGRKFKDLNLNTKNLSAWVEYHKDFRIINNNSFSIKRKIKTGFVAMYFPRNIPMIRGNTYNISGYMSVNGIPITNKSIPYKTINTATKIGTLKINDETGYFEAQQDWVGDNDWIHSFVIHTIINNKDGGFEIDDEITVTDLKLKQVLK